MTTTLIHSVAIFDGHSLISLNGSILLINTLITSILPITPSPLPSADVIINGSGHTVLPGLIDTHVHIFTGEPELKQALRFGLTTVLDMFNEPEQVQKLKSLVAGRMDLADFRSSCHAATIEGGWPAPVIMAIAEDKEAVSCFSSSLFWCWRNWEVMGRCRLLFDIGVLIFLLGMRLFATAELRTI
jgi:hypothetical protein